MAEDVIIKSKELFYRGQSLDTLKTLEVREVAKYLASIPHLSACPPEWRGVGMFNLSCLNIGIDA